MAKCYVCGKDAGWFQDLHPECQSQRAEGWSLAQRTAYEAISAPETWEDLIPRLQTLVDRYGLNMVKGGVNTNIRTSKVALEQGWTQFFNTILRGDLSVEDTRLNRLEEFYGRFLADNDGVVLDRPSAIFDFGGDYNVNTKLHQLEGVKAVAWTIAYGVDENYLSKLRTYPVDFLSMYPIHFSRTERLVWNFPCHAYEERRIVNIRRGYLHGPSMRLGRGLWYRVSSFESRPVPETVTEEIDTIGDLLVTTENLYWYATLENAREKIARFAFDRILGVIAEAKQAEKTLFDGILEAPMFGSLHLELNSSASRQPSFSLFDYPLAYNLLMNLIRSTE